MSPLTTSVEPLEGNKVRLRVAVPADEFEQAVDAAFRKLARQVKIPGFRPGKAPRQLLEARLGGEAAREQALRDSVPDYYAQAIEAEDIDVIAAPEIDITEGEDGGDVAFDAVVEVRPIVELAGYDPLRVEIPATEITDDAVEAQVDALRERFADLEDKTGPLADGDYAQIDIKAYVHDEVVDALSATDFLYEVGSGGLVPKLDEELRSKRVGDILKFNDQLPERFGDRAGDEVSFQVLIKETKRKILPEPTDEWASEVSEYDTVDALRDDARNRLSLVAKVRAQMLVRDKVLEAVAKLVDTEIPDALVTSETERRLHDLIHRLEHEGATLPDYLAATGQDQNAFVNQVRDGAIDAVRADLALRAVVNQEHIEATDEDVDQEVDRLAERLKAKPAKVRRDLERGGMFEAVRSDIARGKALQLLVDHADVVDESGNPVDLTLADDGTPNPETDPPSEDPQEQEPV
ncbi:MAG TPA: trigger factor [Acidimicrobiia bacterium]